jgi:hypothetical protein
MTTIFINRAELLPPGETIEEHTKWQKEEADACQLDKDNKDPRTGGLFKGCFRTAHPPRPSLRVVRDQDDGVDRCPMCAWELEDGECTQCGLFFDDNGGLAWNDSFAASDEGSERDTSGEDLDLEIDMEDAEFGDYDENAAEWQEYMEDETSFMMQRYLAAHGGLPPQLARRRPLTHSEAGSRRSYSHSVSDIYGDEMDTVEEEDEDGLDEDSSMNDFIDDDAGAGAEPTTSPRASSTPGQTPQPTNGRPRVQGRARRVIESESSSSVSGAIEEEDEDEEDDGPIRRGQRNRAQTRILNRANGSREPSGTSSSTTTEASTEQDLDEDTQALLAAEGWMLQHDGPDDEMDEDEDEDEEVDDYGDDGDSDGGRTTVGWDTTAISNDRVRMGGSLTPTADRPRPNAPIRPPSRVGNPRFMDASRGLRRRSSVLSTSTANYEDGEADDDDSDIDRDGDITMAMNSLRSRRSQVLMRPAAPFNNPNNRFVNRGVHPNAPIDLDTDDNSDNSQQGSSRVPTRPRRQEYNPRISWMFADHQRALQEFQRGGPQLDLDPRSTTPVSRPRTSNRNRPSPAQAFSPFVPPTPRLRTPLMDNSSNLASNTRGPLSPPRRSVITPTLPTSGAAGNNFRVERVPSASSTSSASGILTPATSTGRTTPTSQQSVSSTSQAQAAQTVDVIDRPPSRVSRPPSTTGRRSATGFSPVYSGFPHTNVGLNIQGRIFPNQALGNPWGAYVQPRGPRNRPSRPALRDQPSTATLRAAGSRVSLRDGVNPPQSMRSQASRANLQHQPSRRRLNNQASTRTLRASDHARPPPSPTTNTALPTQPATRPPRYTPDERDTLARELINSRMAQLQPNVNPARTNPFFRRPSIPSQGAVATAPMNASHHVRSNSNETLNSITSSVTASPATPSSPNLSRRRSNRNMAAAPPSVMSPTIASALPANAYTNSYFRQRQGSLGAGNQTYESPFSSNTRGMNPMMAGPLI